MSDDLRSYVAIMGEALADGETLRDDCPECGRRKTFTVTRTDDGLLYNCYSASCELTGGVVGGTRRKSIVMPGEPPPKRAFKQFDEPLEQLVISQEEHLYDKFTLSDEALRLGRVRYCDTLHRFAFPILSPRGTRRGYVLRSTDPFARPKALTHMERDEPALAWYNATHADPVVVVEDVPSALRLAARGRKAVALLGTSCGAYKFQEIQRNADAIVWALDPDATGVAQRLHRRYYFFVGRSTVAVLKHDIKDMTEGSLDEFCNTYV